MQTNQKIRKFRKHDDRTRTKAAKDRTLTLRHARRAKEAFRAFPA